jgi:hypothetical protein
VQPVEAFFLTTAEASRLGIAFGAVLAFTSSLAAFFSADGVTTHNVSGSAGDSGS